MFSINFTLLNFYGFAMDKVVLFVALGPTSFIIRWMLASRFLVVPVSCSLTNGVKVPRRQVFSAAERIAVVLLI